MYVSFLYISFHGIYPEVNRCCPENSRKMSGRLCLSALNFHSRYNLCLFCLSFCTFLLSLFYALLLRSCFVSFFWFTIVEAAGSQSCRDENCPAVRCDWHKCVVDRNEDVETVELSELTVNPGEPKTGPHDFELLKLLGKGGYGKVAYLLFQHMTISVYVE